MQVIFFIIFLGIFFLNNLLISILNDFFVIPFVIIQGLMFVGFIEAFHQTIHSKLMPNKNVNVVIGTVIGAFFGTSFQAYRRFHLNHHKYCNTPNDPEILFYKFRDNKKISNPYVTLIFSPAILMRYTGIINKYERKMSNIEKMLIALVYVFLFLVIYKYGWVIFLKHIGIPFLIFSMIEYLIGQSQHYNKEIKNEIDRKDKQSINLILPYWVSFLVLFTNFHSTHHIFPGCPWYGIYNKFKKEEKYYSHNLSFFQFLKLWLKKGPKYL